MPSYLNPDGSFFNESSGGPILLVQDAVAFNDVTLDGSNVTLDGEGVTLDTQSGSVDGSTIRMRAHHRALFVNTALLASVTIYLPPAVESGEIVELCFETGVTALVVRDSDGNLVASAPTSNRGPGDRIALRYISKSYGWFFWSGGVAGSNGSSPTLLTLDGQNVTLDGTPVSMT